MSVDALGAGSLRRVSGGARTGLRQALESACVARAPGGDSCVGAPFGQTVPSSSSLRQQIFNEHPLYARHSWRPRDPAGNETGMVTALKDHMLL